MTFFRARHIQLDSEEAAQLVLDQLKSGGDFAELASQYSTCPTAPQFGDLGTFGSGHMPEEFEAAVLAAEPGDRIGPLQTRWGWHVIDVLNHQSDAV